MQRRYNVDERRLVEVQEDPALVTVFINPDESEKKYLVETLKLDEHTLYSALDPDELGRLEFEPEHVAIIFKRPKRYSQEDQFLFSKEFLPGTVTIYGKIFKNINIKYDLYKDEILTPYNPGEILQLNKEIVDSFSIFFQHKTYQFARIPEDGLEGLKGYVNVLYKGKTALYIKHIKKINRPGVENEHDTFYQVSRIYFVNNNLVQLITNKSDLFSALKAHKAQIRDFIKKNKLAVSKNAPESFIPVIRYYDSINQ